MDGRKKDPEAIMAFLADLREKIFMYRALWVYYRMQQVGEP
jgi:hypothetical protein